MNNKFKAGDIIKLKSGSRTMTVSGNATKPTHDGAIAIPGKYECFWMDGNKIQKAIFQEELIVLA